MDITTNAAAIEGIQSLADGYGFSPERIVSMALNWNVYGGTGYVWEVISYDQESATEYYASLDAETRFYEACEALAASGWTRSSICFRLS